MKTFNIEGINIEIEDELFKEACRVYVLEDENNLIVSDTVEDCRRSNYLTLKNAIRAGLCKTEEDFINFSFSKMSNYSNNEICNAVKTIIVNEIKENGGSYDTSN